MTASPSRKRFAILISGRGSNMKALVAAARDPAFPAEPVVVISNRPEAEGLAWAKAQGLPALGLDHKRYQNRAHFDGQLTQALELSKVELVCLAGFMRLLSPEFVTRWHDRLINIHPALLPAFKGLDTHARALAAGVRIHGCTVHLVRPEMDEGPILGQAAVPVESGDTEQSLAARVLAAEHALYPHALALYASGKLSVAGNLIKVNLACDTAVNQAAPLFSPPL